MQPKTNTRTRTRFIVVAIFASLIAVGFVSTASAQETVDLGTADPFAILAGSAVTNTGPSVINGDIGVHPGTAVTGFESATVNGDIHSADAVAEQAKADLTAAYNDAAARSPATSLATELGGQELLPGVYDSESGTFGLTGELTLDAQEDPAAVWIFQMDSTLITATDSSVVLINGAQACNVFWQVGSSATLGTRTDFKGNIMAEASITMNNGATLDGRALARTEAVTLDTNEITIAQCAPEEEPPAEEPPADDPPADDPPADDPPADDPPADDPPADDPPADDPPADDPPADDPPGEEPHNVCVTDLMASANNNASITLTWTSAEGAQQYRIHRAVGGGALTLHDEVDGDATSFTDADTEAGMTYRYDVRPVNGGVESEDCGTVEVTAIPVFPSIVAGALAIAASLAGYVMLRRRR